MHSWLWLLGQLVIVVAWSAVLIAGVVAIWYAGSMLVLFAVSRLFSLRGRRTKDS